MKITQLQRQQAEDKASEVQLRLYAEPEAGEQLWAIATKFGLTERTVYYKFTQMVGDIILGFYKISDTLQLVQQHLSKLEPIKQLELEMEIKKFLLPLISPQVNLQAEIAEIESVANSLESLAPTQKAIARIQPDTPTYRSSQDTLLNPTQTERVLPTSAPRWDSQ